MRLTRDIRYTREYMGDLRNRVVGARIIEDGGSPYFYKWKPGDSVAVLRPARLLIFTIPSISTSTPFLHRLLMPARRSAFCERSCGCGWSCSTFYCISRWRVYALTLAPRDTSARLAVAGGRVAVPADERLGIAHAKYGQTYLLIPALAMLVFALRRWPVLAAGTGGGGMLVMVRPNAVLFRAAILARPRS
jgi:hypothetical protein